MINMRLNRFTLFVFLCMILWGTVAYFTFFYNLNENNSPASQVAMLEQQLDRFERTLQEEFALNRDIVGNLNNMIKWKREEFIEEEEEHHSSSDFKGTVMPILVFACNRVSVARCLDKLIQYRPNADQFPIIVSQDCDDEPTAQVIQSYGSQVMHIKQPDQSDIHLPPSEKKFKGYYKISRHYGWALNQTFFYFNFKTVVIVEDDLDVSSDFYEYFLGTYSILKKDPTLYCVSAWNDNGKVGLVDENRPDLLYRTDFFPGLGWMLTKTLWLELSSKWPPAFWDDWIRKPEQRKDRACIRPELSRTRTFGKIGVSNGLFFDKHLKFIRLNEKYVPFAKMNLSFLMKDIYDGEFLRTVYQSAVVSYEELRDNKITYDGPVRIPYHTKNAYKKTAKLLGLMDDFKSGVPRMGYRGIVTFHYKARTVYLAPNMNWKGYDTSWS